MSNALQTTQQAATPVAYDDSVITVDPRRFEQLANMRKNIKAFVGQQLTPNIDYGTIPGTQKPTLYQPGMQKIHGLLGVYADNEVHVIDMGNGHREYRVRTVIRRLGTDTAVATGTGSCSTMESKYRYRKSDGEDTGRPVPQEYWKHNKTNLEKAQDLLGGKGFKAVKVGTRWTIFKYNGGRVENPDPADQYNTCLKMAAKRANIAATLNLTGGWDEEFMDEDVAPSAAEPVVNTAIPNEDPRLEEIRATFRTWAKDKQDAMLAKQQELMAEGLAEDDAIISAFDHTEKYRQ